MPSHDVCDLLEAAVHDAGPVPEGAERRARRLDGCGVPVDAEDPEVGPGGEDRRRVTASADGGVDEEPGRDLRHQRQHFGEEHRGVLEGFARHSFPFLVPVDTSSARSVAHATSPGWILETATSPPDASTKAKRAEGALAPHRPGDWWRARRACLSRCSVVLACLLACLVAVPCLVACCLRS